MIRKQSNPNWMNKKVKAKLILIVVSILLFGGCNKDDGEQFVYKTQEEKLIYETSNLNSYTVDEKGNLFTGEHIVDVLQDDMKVCIYQYDPSGTIIYSHVFEEKFSSSVLSMNVYQDTMYFTISGHNDNVDCVSLYEFKLDTEELAHLYDFEGFVDVKEMIYMDQMIYVLGQKKYASNINGSLDSYQSKGEELLYYSLMDQKAYQLDINLPIDMSRSDRNSFMIYSYQEDKGYCMLEYDPKEDTIDVLAQFDEYKFDTFTMVGSDQLLYTYNLNPRGVVLSKLSALEEEAEIYSTTNYFYPIYYVDGNVYCGTDTFDIVRFPLNTPENEKTIQYISSGYRADEAFGYGYTMNRVELEDDEFALKVLAQDKDYDLCLMNSMTYNSHNIRENGVFYPLNDVKGIKEYLDSCYSYVKEAAMDSEGNIWMIPIGVDIPSLIGNTEYLASNHMSLRNDMTYEEFYQIQVKLTEDQKEKINCNSYLIYLNFFSRIFDRDMEFDSDAFRTKLELFRTYHKIMPDIHTAVDLDGEMLYSYNRDSSYYQTLIDQYGDRKELVAYSMPKINSSDQNIGTVTFLAVNGNSNNLKETFRYLETLIDATRKQNEKPLFFQRERRDDKNFAESIYQLYENGGISFYIDRDVYVKGFFDVIENDGNIEAYIMETKRKLDVYFNE